MRPLQLEVTGLMTHREPTVIDFRGNWLWTITGANGSGKSALFDAITYVLYGRHRFCDGNSTHDESLLSQDRDFMRVVLDFEIEGNAYRVERTLMRSRGRKRTSWKKSFQAYALRTEADLAEVSVPIQGTDSSHGLNAWVVRTLGVGFNAFVSAILLRQGDAERFVSAPPGQRQGILLEMLDLQPYVRLEELAKQRARDLRARIEGAEKEVSALAGASKEAVKSCQEDLDRFRTSLAAADRAVEDAVRRSGLAESFQRASLSLSRVGPQLATVEEVLKGGAEVERDWRERATLQRLLPVLQRAVQLESTSRAAAERAERLREQARLLDVAGLKQVHQEQAAGVDGARKRLDEARGETARARQYETKLRPVNRAGERRNELIAEFRDTDAQLVELERQSQDGDKWEGLRGECESAALALPYLEDLIVQRRESAEAAAEVGRLQHELESLEGALETLRAQSEDASREVQAAYNDYLDRSHRYTVTTTRLAHVADELSGREAAAREGTCSRCGQRVDPAHIERELSEARKRKTALQDEVARLGEQLKMANERKTDASEAEARIAEALNVSRQRRADALRERDRQVEARDKAWTQAESAIRHLPEVYAARAGNLSYPSASIVEQTRSLSHRLTEARERCRDLERIRGQVEMLRLQQAKRVDEARQLESEYGLDVLQSAQAVYREARAKVEAGERAERGLEAEFTAASECLRNAREELDAAEARLADILAEEERERQASTADAHAAEEFRSSLRADYGDLARSDSVGVSALLLRMKELEDVDEKLRALQEARTNAERLRSQAAALREELDSIPLDCHVKVEQALEARCTATKERDELRELVGGARERLSRLTDELQRKEILESSAATLRRDRGDYLELARLFGKDMLQAWLVQEAQQAIKDQANDFLSNVSGGTLTLDLRREGEELELLVYDLTSANAPLNVSGISGSQRFRVSVALALAVGEYSGQGSRRIRSVIIDEGFGGLDELGRQEMIEQIKSLSGLLDCVILVSHQEAFQDAFPNGYQIEKRGTISTATYRNRQDASAAGQRELLVTT